MAAAVRDDLRRTGDALHSVRERQAQHVAEREADLATLREAVAEPATKLARLEEARRADAAAVQNAVALAGQLASAHQQMRAAIEKLGRLISENESVVVAELTDIRTEAAAAAATVREMAEERAARQQADVALALDAARQAQETASTLHEATSRLRGRIEGAVQQLVSEEGQRLKRAADHAEAELRAHEEQRHRADGP